jgi:hypothetical protein
MIWGRRNRDLTAMRQREKSFWFRILLQGGSTQCNKKMGGFI